MRQQIEITGLAGLSRGLRAVDSDAPKELRLVFNDSADLLVDRTRPKIPVRTGRSRASLKARSTRTAARVAVGGTRAPWYPWLDFGGQGRVKGRPAARPFVAEGRYFYPTLREIRPELEQRLQEGITNVIERAGLVEG